MFKTILCIVFTLLVLPGKSIAQVDTVFRVETLKKNTDFASLTLGTDVLILPGSTAGNVQNPARFQPRITMGGLHFWGHADFYVTFPLGRGLGEKPKEASRFVYFESVETGFKYYPFTLKPGRLRPYAGMSFQPFLFRIDPAGSEYEHGGARHSAFVSPVQCGLTYAGKKWLFTAGARYNWRNTFDYYQSPETTIPVKLNAWSFNASVLFYMDTDRQYSSEKSVDQLNKKHYVLTKEKSFDSWYLGFGPSSALQMSRSPYLRKNIPYLYNQMIFSGFVPDLAIGRYFHKGRMNVNLAARYMSQNIKAFDTKIHVSRGSVALETHHFLFNYRGFVPFVGPSLNVENLVFHQKGAAKVSETKLALGFVFGWDINLTDVETSLLRTNLRYIPGLHLSVEGEKMMYDYLEFNFIQYVYFFNRAKTFKKYRKK